MSCVWATLLGDVEVSEGEVLLYLDPHALDLPVGSYGMLVRVRDRWSLRRLMECQLRDRRPSAEPLFVHVTIAGLDAIGDLPADVQVFPVLSLDIRVPPDVLQEIVLLPSAAVAALAHPGSLAVRTAAAARELTGLAWPPPPNATLLSCLRLATTAGPALRAILADSCPPGPGRAILEAANPMDPLSELWREWAKLGSAHPYDIELRAATDDLADLAASGRLAIPDIFDEGLPPAITELQATDTQFDVTYNLLGAMPASSDDLEGWFGIADLWAEIRWSIAAAPPTVRTVELENKAWSRWADVDSAWQSWIKDRYGTLLSRNVLNPTSVHMVAPYLAATSVANGARVLLLVLDGLGIAQWQYIRRALGLEVVEDRHLLACLPTITTVSRQAIFAGKLPIKFAATIDRTDVEPEHWLQFWTQGGLAPDEIYYGRVFGRDSSEWIDPPETAVVSGIVVNAVDELMHGVSVNGDHQFHAGLATWCQSGFISSALAWARRNTVQVWVTSDHGNLPCAGLDQAMPQEGVLVTGKGQRVRRYRSNLLRESSQVPGEAWSPPGYPPAAGSLLFAPGRKSYRREGLIVSHGGLSMDEVIVPLARVLP